MRRLVIVVMLIGTALVPIACTPPPILSTISCPVVEPGATMIPEAPRQCGGQR